MMPPSIIALVSWAALGALADRLGVAAVALFAVAVCAPGAALSLLDGFAAQAARRTGN
jgi:hypothetical protein